MSKPARIFGFSAPFFCLVAMGGFAGCAVFIPSHNVAVDAITSPFPTAGLGYRLVDSDPMAARNAAQHKLVLASVAAALDTKGIFEAPMETVPDLYVAVDYGVNRGTGVPRMLGVTGTTELFLQLSARRPKPEGAPGKGEEVWNVRVSINEDGMDLGSAIPVLAAVAADHAGLDTQTEKTIKVSEKDPGVVHVKSVARSVTQPRSSPSP